MNKECKKCSTIKPLSEFWKDKRLKDERRSYCIECEKKRNQSYFKEYYRKNKEEILLQKKQWRKDNPELAKAKDKEHWEKYGGKYPKDKEKTNARLRERRINDPNYKLSECIRDNVKRIAKKIKTDRDNPSLEHLGCSLEEFRLHIESQWEEGMSWENHGLYGWHIDHIVPLSSFLNSDNPWAANHYTNLQPLWAKDNLSKGAKND